MKLAPLLAQYLYSNKRLDLPAIGTFLLDNTIHIESENSKDTYIEGVSFENNSSIKESPGLISFISSQTGKMKALAMADLDSHLEQARQFLNIGKPFLFEGIGSLVKIRSGDFAFTSGQIMPDKMKEYSAREISSTSTTEESFSYIDPKEKKKWRKPVAFLLLVAGIGLAVLGGYTVYKRTADKDNFSAASNDNNQAIETTLIADSSTHLKKDSAPLIKDSIPTSIQSTPKGNYKFVIEVANKERGLHRFATLKNYFLNVKMETTDSVNFKLFFLLPAAVSDTSRIIDSLSNLYTPSWKKAFVEN